MSKANDHFGNSNGSEHMYKHTFKISYSDGVKSLAEACQSYWLIDLIASHQTTRQVEQEPFQVWELLKKTECEFEVVATDGNHRKIASQIIPFSDFPYDMATLWLIDQTLILPSEY